MKSNTRSSARVFCGMPASVKVPTGPLRGVARNLSRGGLFLSCPTLVPVGRPLTVWLDIPGDRTLRASGEVRHHWKYADGQGMGIRFVSLGPEDRDCIARFVSARVAPLSAAGA